MFLFNWPTFVELHQLGIAATVFYRPDGLLVAQPGATQALQERRR